MKRILLVSIVLFTLVVGTKNQVALSAEPVNLQVNYGIGFLPLDFYLDHREQLGLSEDQRHEMQKIIEGMRESGEKLAGEMQERTKSLQEVVVQNPLNADSAMERFKSVMAVENEIKRLQFRGRVELRKILTPEQYEKVRAVVAHAQLHGDFQSKLDHLRQQLAKRSGGDVPGEAAEQLERIEQTAKQGRVVEAERQLDALLGRVQGDDARGEGGMEQQMHRLKEAMKNATTDEERERIEQQMRRLREGESQRAGEEARKGNQNLQQMLRHIAEVEQHVDKPEVREQLRGALARLNEAIDAGNQQVIEEILHAIQPLLEGNRLNP